jgi:hypothetical protein
LTRAQIEAGLDEFIAAEGEPEVVMFSGGEPSIHPQILEFCAMARDKAWRPRAQRDGSWNLPVPATLVLDRDGIVRARHVDPNCRERMSVDAVLSALIDCR